MLIGEALLAGTLQSLRAFKGMGGKDLSGMLSGPRRPLLAMLSTVGLTPLELFSQLPRLLPNLTNLLCEEIPDVGELQLEDLLRASPPGAGARRGWLGSARRR